MLLQKARIGKTAVLIIILILLGALAALPLFLRADNTGEANRFLYLPLILHEADGRLDPAAEATATFTASPTIHPTITASATPSSTATATPTNTSTEPYIQLLPDCGPGPDIFFYIQGYNWPEDESIMISWADTPIIFLPAIQHSGNFSFAWTAEGLTTGLYTVSAVSGTSGITASDFYTIPCGASITPTPTATNTATPTPINCDVQFENPVFAGDDAVDIVGDPGIDVSIINVTTGITIGMGTLNGPVTGHACEGFNTISLSPPLLFSDAGNVLLVMESNNPDNNDSTIINPMPTITPSPIPPSSTPVPADLVVGQPQLVSTPPIIVYQPLAFEVPITNTGDIDINTLFFVDLLFDPPPVHIEDSYTAVSGLSGGSTVTLTITSTIGLANFIGDHQVTALVDSLDHVIEADETNNLSAPFEITITEPAMTPNYTPTPTGTSTISGIAIVLWDIHVYPQERMRISAIEETTGEVVAVTYSDENGFYQFDNLIEDVAYTIQGCITIDNNAYFGVLPNKIPPDTLANIVAFPNASCP
ncbi:MAG: hypothetical protein H6653_12690 [Ardenticatenaceae bacterium]|nr:hypothetical protein [Ardenticatenaceae bacterium]